MHDFIHTGSRAAARAPLEVGEGGGGDAGWEGRRELQAGDGPRADGGQGEGVGEFGAGHLTAGGGEVLAEPEMGVGGALYGAGEVAEGGGEGGVGPESGPDLPAGGVGVVDQQGARRVDFMGVRSMLSSARATLARRVRRTAGSVPSRTSRMARVRT